jgi:hypothetical protein
MDNNSEEIEINEPNIYPISKYLEESFIKNELYNSEINQLNNNYNFSYLGTTNPPTDFNNYNYTDLDYLVDQDFTTNFNQRKLMKKIEKTQNFKFIEIDETEKLESNCNLYLNNENKNRNKKIKEKRILFDNPFDNVKINLIEETNHHHNHNYINIQNNNSNFDDIVLHGKYYNSKESENHSIYSFNQTYYNIPLKISDYRDNQLNKENLKCNINSNYSQKNKKNNFLMKKKAKKGNYKY